MTPSASVIRRFASSSCRSASSPTAEVARRLRRRLRGADCSGDRAAGWSRCAPTRRSTGGIIHKPMFERLILCDYAVADLTTAPTRTSSTSSACGTPRARATTVLVCADGARLPFDVAPLRALPYALGHDGGRRRIAGEGLRKLLERPCAHARARRPTARCSSSSTAADAEIDRLKTDVFRDRAAYSAEVKQRLAAARAGGERRAARGRARPRATRGRRGRRASIDLLLSYRAVKGWEEMIELVEADAARRSRRTVMVREQSASPSTERGAARTPSECCSS